MKRILALLTYSAQLIADGKASKAQAESATRAAAALLETQSQQSESKTTSTDLITEDFEQNLKLKDDEIQSLKTNLKTAKIDLEVMMKQSESVAREYDNLLKEHAKLTLKLEKLEYGSNDSKKDH